MIISVLIDGTIIYLSLFSQISNVRDSNRCYLLKLLGDSNNILLICLIILEGDIFKLEGRGESNGGYDLKFIPIHILLFSIFLTKKEEKEAHLYKYYK